MAGWYLSKTGGGAIDRKESSLGLCRQSIVVTKKRDGGISKHRRETMRCSSRMLLRRTGRYVDHLLIDTLGRCMVDGAVILVYFSVSPQVGDDREMATAAVDFTCECYRTVSAK